MPRLAVAARRRPALDVLEARTDDLVLTTLRRWDPDAGTVRPISP